MVYSLTAHVQKSPALFGGLAADTGVGMRRDAKFIAVEMPGRFTRGAEGMIKFHLVSPWLTTICYWG